jgi:N-acetylneuraminic acid mutarotase
MHKSTTMFLLLISLAVACMFPAHSAIALTDKWVEKAPMPTERYYFGAVAVNGTIYAIGGITYIPERKPGHITTTTNVNEAYDPANDVWTEKAPMPSPHWLDSYGIAVWQNKIYCIGGPANNVYDPATDTWETKTPMPSSRHFLTANVVNEKIYLIGGLALGPPPAWAGNGYITYSSSNLTEVYEPATDSWSEKSPIPYAVDSYASAVIDNKIYVISGRVGGNLTGLVQVYDTLIDKWSYATPIPIPVEPAAAGMMTIANKKAIFVVGGRVSWGTGNGTDLNQVYFPENDSWTTGAPLLANRFALSVAVVNDRLYAIGGMGNSEYTATMYQYTPANPTETDSITPPQSSSPSNETQIPISTPELSIIAILLLTTLAVLAIAMRRKRRKQSQHNSETHSTTQVQVTGA